MKVRQIMKRRVRACGPGSNLGAAGRLMAEAGCGVLPVLDESQRVVGILTDRDITMALVASDRRASEIRTAQVMTHDVHACGPDDNVRDALRVMREHSVRRLPVVDEDRHLLGMLSLDDAVLEARAFETQGFTGPFYADIAATLRAISQHQAAVMAH